MSSTEATLSYTKYMSYRSEKFYRFLAFLLILPILQSYLFNVAIGGKPKHLNLAVVNEEMSPSNCAPSLYNGCVLSEEEIYNENITLSCMFLDYLKNETYNFVSTKGTAYYSIYFKPYLPCFHATGIYKEFAVHCRFFFEFWFVFWNFSRTGKVR